MNKFFKLFLMTTMAFTVFACGEDDEPVPAPVVLSVNAVDKAQAFEVTGGSKTVVVTASAAFTATSDQTWCTISGLTQVLFKIDVAANTTTEARTAKITVALSGATSIEIAVSQAAVVLPPAILMAQPHMLTFDTPKVGEKYATVTINRPDYDVTVQAGADWLTTEKTADQLDQLLLKIKVAANFGETDREATITLHVDGATDVVLHITQAAGYAPVDPGATSAKWNVATPNRIEWYTRGDNKTIGTPTVGGGPSTVAGPGTVQAWALGQDDHIKVQNPLATAPASTVYTMVWDVRVPKLSGYCSLLQTKEDNNDGDGDVFINGKKVGLGSYSGDVLTENTWHRIVASVNVDAATETKSVVFYVDGYLAHLKSISSDGDIDRYTLRTIFWLFLDDGNEVYALDCAGVSLWDKALTREEVLFLGTPTTAIN